MRREGYPAVTVSILYLAGVAAGLWFAAPFFGWGTGPETGFGLMALKNVSLLGYPLPEMIGRIAVAVPAGSAEFSSATAGAVLLGLTLVFIFAAVLNLGGSRAAGAAASVSFLVFPGTLGSFQNVSPSGWTLFLGAALAAAAVGFFKQRNRRSFLILAFAAGVGMFHHGFLFIAGLGALAVSVYVMDKKDRAGNVALGVTAAALGIAPLVFLVLRTPLFVNWTSKLAPWIGVLSPMGSIPLLLLGGIERGPLLSGAYQLSQPLSREYLPLFVAAALGIVLHRERRRVENIFVWSCLALAALFVIFGASLATQFNLTILIMFLAICGAVGFSAILEPGLKARGGASSVAAGLVFLLVAAAPVFLGMPRTDRLRADGTRDYYLTMLKSMRRDALFVADVREDPLYGLDYLQEYKGLRQDIAIVRTDCFTAKAYRKYFRSAIQTDVVMMGEEQYTKALEQVSTLVPKALGGTPTPQFRQRLIDGILSMVDEFFLFSNYARRPVYFNRIDRLFTTKFYSMMQFMPASLVFYLRSEPQPVIDEEILALAKRRSFSDAGSRRLIAGYYENIGENFFTQERFGPAAAFFEAGLKLQPDNIPCNFFLGLIYKKFGRFDDAVNKYYRTLTLLKKKELGGVRDNNDVLMYARIYTELNMPEKANEYYRLVVPDGLSSP
jgi:hypothetical protein